MSISERLFGSGPDSEKKITVEKVTKLLKWFDVGTIFGALVLAGLAPALAATLIAASVASIAGTEIVESGLKRRKKKG